MDSSMDIKPIHDWLKGFSYAVRSKDFVSGRRFFADDVVGFGSVAERCDGLENLENQQWRKVWGVTTEFEFDLESAAVNVDGNVAWAASSWQSYGKASSGDPLLRRGRCTFVFQKRNEQWLAVHSHFSLEPRE